MGAVQNLMIAGLVTTIGGAGAYLATRPDGPPPGTGPAPRPIGAGKFLAAAAGASVVGAGALVGAGSLMKYAERADGSRLLRGVAAFGSGVLVPPAALGMVALVGFAGWNWIGAFAADNEMHDYELDPRSYGPYREWDDARRNAGAAATGPR